MMLPTSISSMRSVCPKSIAPGSHNFSQALQEPIIHRVIAKLRARDGVYFLTKGDSAHNPLIDQETHITQYAVPASEVQGKMVLRVPFLGWVKLLVFDVPKNLVSGCYVNGRCPFP